MNQQLISCLLNIYLCVQSASNKQTTILKRKHI